MHACREALEPRCSQEAQHARRIASMQGGGFAPAGSRWSPGCCWRRAGWTCPPQASWCPPPRTWDCAAPRCPRSRWSRTGWKQRRDWSTSWCCRRSAASAARGTGSARLRGTGCTRHAKNPQNIYSRPVCPGKLVFTLTRKQSGLFCWGCTQCAGACFCLVKACRRLGAAAAYLPGDGPGEGAALPIWLPISLPISDPESKVTACGRRPPSPCTHHREKFSFCVEDACSMNSRSETVPGAESS